MPNIDNELGDVFSTHKLGAGQPPPPTFSQPSTSTYFSKKELHQRKELWYRLAGLFIGEPPAPEKRPRRGRRGNVSRVSLVDVRARTTRSSGRPHKIPGQPSKRISRSAGYHRSTPGRHSRHQALSPSRRRALKFEPASLDVTAGNNNGLYFEHFSIRF